MVNNHKILTAIERLQSFVEDLDINTKEIYDTKEAAKYLGLSVSKVYKLAHLRQVPHYKRGKLLRFKKSELEGARMGVDIAKHRAQMAVQQAQRASQNKPKKD